MAQSDFGHLVQVMAWLIFSAKPLLAPVWGQPVLRHQMPNIVKDFSLIKNFVWYRSWWTLWPGFNELTQQLACRSVITHSRCNFFFNQSTKSIIRSKPMPFFLISSQFYISSILFSLTRLALVLLMLFQRYLHLSNLNMQTAHNVDGRPPVT